MNPADRMAVEITADLLDRGRSIDDLASAITFAAVLTGLMSTMIGVPGVAASGSSLGWTLAIIALGLIEKYLAIRVAFDAALLHRCATEQSPMSTFDDAMRALNLLAPSKIGRGWLERCRGARRLLELQAMLLAAQLLVLAIAIATAIH